LTACVFRAASRHRPLTESDRPFHQSRVATHRPGVRFRIEGDAQSPSHAGSTPGWRLTLFPPAKITRHSDVVFRQPGTGVLLKASMARARSDGFSSFGAMWPKKSLQHKCHTGRAQITSKRLLADASATHLPILSIHTTCCNPIALFHRGVANTVRITRVLPLAPSAPTFRLHEGRACGMRAVCKHAR